MNQNRIEIHIAVNPKPSVPKVGKLDRDIGIGEILLGMVCAYEAGHIALNAREPTIEISAIPSNFVKFFLLPMHVAGMFAFAMVICLVFGIFNFVRYKKFKNN